MILTIISVKIFIALEQFCWIVLQKHKLKLKSLLSTLLIDYNYRSIITILYYDTERSDSPTSKQSITMKNLCCIVLLTIAISVIPHSKITFSNEIFNLFFFNNSCYLLTLKLQLVTRLSNIAFFIYMFSQWRSCNPDDQHI